MAEISATAHSSAAPERVWELLADVDSWSRWSAFDESGLESEGAPEPGGVGAVRRFRAGRTRTRERVVVFDPPWHFAYELVSGIPIRDYRADVTLTREGGGTSISWKSSFRGRFPVPAGFVRGRLEAFVRDTAEKLARAAER